ncbi:hypothetical protein ES703_34272 [subsurface metagenome]
MKFKLKADSTFFRLSSKNECSESVVAPGILPPAPFINISTLSNLFTIFLAASSTLFLLRTSTLIIRCSMLLSLSSFESLSVASSEISRTTTFPPQLPIALAISEQSSPAPPVITTTFPLRLKQFFIFILFSHSPLN